MILDNYFFYVYGFCGLEMWRRFRGISFLFRDGWVFLLGRFEGWGFGFFGSFRIWLLAGILEVVFLYGCLCFRRGVWVSSWCLLG